jgi:hypothetical protein
MTSLSGAMLGSVALVVAGLILVFLGRRLFWFFVGVVGFVFGFRFGLTVFSDSTMTLVLAAAVGVIAALLSVVLEKVLIVLTGAAAGWLLFVRLAEILGAGPQLTPILPIVGAVLFAVVSLLVFDVALIVISSLSGAALVLEPFALVGTMELVLFVALAAVGIATQLRTRPLD